MGKHIEFVQNFSDLSTDKGFQFEFHCAHCGKTYRTRFKPTVTGTVSTVLDGASSLLGGFFSRAADISDRVRSASWEKAHDEAFEAAVKEIDDTFFQCPRCNSLVCREKCLNTKRGLCKGCAPDLGVEMSAAQASHSVQEIWAHAAMAEEDKKLAAENWRQTIRATCPNCEEPLAVNAKFCPACGTKLKAPGHCTECGATLTPEAKFCPDCGQKVG